MNVMSLNFLQHTPDENWFDYFINYEKFLELLKNDHADRKLIEQLFDQFVTQALLTVSEAKINSKRKRIEQGRKYAEKAFNSNLDDVVFSEQKADKLWLLGWACAARLGWDLDALLKCSNVIRVFSMISRLFEHTFDVKGESDILSYLSRSEDTTFDSKKSFVTWLYARLVLIIDMQARAPAPPQKPTVSNPLNQVDPALMEADKITNFISKVRNHTRNAAVHLERLIALNLSKVEAPTFYCFQQIDSQNGNPSSSRNQNHIEVSGDTFAVRVKCDLLLAHFAASHFGTAKKLLNEIEPQFALLSNVNATLNGLFLFDSKKFNGYKAALVDNSKLRGKRSKLDINAFEFNTQRNKTLNEPNMNVVNQLENATKLFESAVSSIEEPILYSISQSSDCFLVYTNQGPPLWQILNCFDYTRLLKLYTAFCEWDINEKAFLNRIVKGNCSPIFSRVLEENPVENEPILFYLMQLERLIDNWNLEHWRAVIPTFLDRMVKGKWSKHVHAICYELLRVHERMFNSMLGNEKNLKAFTEISKETQRLVTEALKTNNSLTKWAHGLVDRIHFVSLLNFGQFTEILNFPKVFPDISSQYLTFSRIVATFISFEQKNNMVQWNYFTPLLHRGNSNSDMTLSRENFIEMVKMIKNDRLCAYIVSHFASLYNKGVNTVERQQYPYTEGMQAKNTEILYLDKSILNVKQVDILDKLTKDFEKINFDFLLTVMEILLRNSLISLSNNPFILCQLSDVLYATGRYEEAAQLYTTILSEFEGGAWDMSDYDKVVTDSMVTKLVHCFYEMKFFTLSAITGQLLRDVRVHLRYIPAIIKQTSQTNDSGKAYFSYIYNIPVFEAMAEAYERNDFYTYYLQILKLCPTRASNQGNSFDVVREEISRRRSQFVEILFRTMNNNPTKLKPFSEKFVDNV